MFLWKFIVWKDALRATVTYPLQRLLGRWFSSGRWCGICFVFHEGRSSFQKVSKSRRSFFYGKHCLCHRPCVHGSYWLSCLDLKHHISLHPHHHPHLSCWNKAFYHVPTSNHHQKKQPTSADGSEIPNNHLGWCLNLVNTGISYQYQPQQVGEILNHQQSHQIQKGSTVLVAAATPHKTLSLLASFTKLPTCPTLRRLSSTHQCLEEFSIQPMKRPRVWLIGSWGVLCVCVCLRSSKQKTDSD